MADLEQLARLLAQRNTLDGEIAALLARPALSNHIGEFVAAEIFGLQLNPSASAKGNDGCFTSGSLNGCTINVKFKAKNDGLLNLGAPGGTDYYLVLAGARAPAASSRGTTQPWVISEVFLFQAADLHEALKARGAKIGVATSVIRSLWDAAQIYPESNNRAFVLTAEQRQQLALFGAPKRVATRVATATENRGFWRTISGLKRRVRA